MRPIPKITALGIVLLACSGYSGCEDKDGATHLLLGHGALFRKDPVLETTFFTSEFPGVRNPFVDDIDTQWSIYARRNVGLGTLWGHELNLLRFRVYDDGAGFTPTLVAEQTYTLPADGRVNISLRDVLTSHGATLQTPFDYRINLGAAGTLQIGSKKDLKAARKAFLNGMEPYPAGAGRASVFAWTKTVVDGQGAIVSQEWRDFPAFIANAF